MQSAAKPRRKGRRLWKNSVMAMAAVVVFCTVYALVLPAITMAGDPICGQTEHTHGDGCYRGYVMTAQCPAADSGTVIGSCQTAQEGSEVARMRSFGRP